jgi:hypothetical protein
MKSFSTYITELEQDWEYMKKPKKQFPAAVDEFGRTINIPTLPKDSIENLPNAVAKGKPFMWKRGEQLRNAPPGTEDAAERKLRSSSGSLSMLPRKLGPSMNPEKEQNDTVDQMVIKRDTQDDPEINVDQLPPKKRKRM